MKFRGFNNNKKKKSRSYNFKMKFITEPSANRIKEMSSSGFFPEQPPRFLARGREPQFVQFVPVKLLALHR